MEFNKDENFEWDESYDPEQLSCGESAKFSFSHKKNINLIDDKPLAAQNHTQSQFRHKATKKKCKNIKYGEESWWWSDSYASQDPYTEWYLKYGRFEDMRQCGFKLKRRRYGGAFNSNPLPNPFASSDYVGSRGDVEDLWEARLMQGSGTIEAHRSNASLASLSPHNSSEESENEEEFKSPAFSPIPSTPILSNSEDEEEGDDKRENKTSDSDLDYLNVVVAERSISCPNIQISTKNLSPSTSLTLCDNDIIDITASNSKISVNSSDSEKSTFLVSSSSSKIKMELLYRNEKAFIGLNSKDKSKSALHLVYADMTTSTTELETDFKFIHQASSQKPTTIVEGEKSGPSKILPSKIPRLVVVKNASPLKDVEKKIRNSKIPGLIKNKK